MARTPLTSFLQRLRVPAPPAAPLPDTETPDDAAPVAADRADLEHFPFAMLAKVPPEHLKPWRFPPYLDNPACPWLQTLKRLYAMPVSFPASLSPEAGLLLHALVRNAAPRLVVETGSFIGISTLWIAAALDELGDAAVVHSFDDFGPITPGPWRLASMTDDRLAFVSARIAEAGLTRRAVLHPGPSAPTMLAFLREQDPRTRVQLAFLDADHSEAGLLADFRAVEPFLATGGFVVLHDTFPEICGWDGPRKVLDRLTDRLEGEYEVVDLYLQPINFGLAVLRRIG